MNISIHIYNEDDEQDEQEENSDDTIQVIIEWAFQVSRKSRHAC
jgi:hypothetical protein